MILKELLTAMPEAAGSAVSPSAILDAQPPETRGADWTSRRARECAGDLDAIVARACAPTPGDRYPSAAEMADDLRAWLQVRPLKARRGDRAYVLKKFVRRRRLRVLAGAVAAAGLLLSLTVATLLYAQADHARRQAEDRFVEVRSLARYLLYDVYDRLEQAPRTLAMRHDLTQVAQTYLKDLAHTPSAPVDVKRDVVESFVRLAEIQAGRRGSNLGKPAETRETLDQAAQLLAELEKSGPLTASDLQQRIRISLLHTLLSANADQDLAAAGRYLAAAQADLARLPDSPDARRLQVLTALEATDQANWNSDYAGGIVHANTALALIGKLSEADSIRGDIREAGLLARTLRGDSYYYLGRPEEAAAEYAEVIRLADTWFNAFPESMRARKQAILARWNLGTTLLSMDEPHAALEVMQAAALLLPRLVEFEPAEDNTVRTENGVTLAYAQALAGTGQLNKGLEQMRAQIERRKRRHEADPDIPEYARAHAITLSALGDMLAENRREMEACPAYQAADAIFQSLLKRNRLASFDTSEGSWSQVKASIKKYCGSL
jgi:tetratricopeptide (TPR) repeat protein